MKIELRPGSWVILPIAPRARALLLLSAVASDTVWLRNVLSAPVPREVPASVDLIATPHVATAGGFLVARGVGDTVLVSALTPGRVKADWIQDPEAPPAPDTAAIAAQAAAMVPVPETPEPPAPPDLSGYITRDELEAAVQSLRPDLESIAAMLRDELEQWLLDKMPGWVRKWAPRRRGGGGGTRMPAGASMPVLVPALPDAGYADQTVILEADGSAGPAGASFKWVDGEWVRKPFRMGWDPDAPQGGGDD